MQKTCQESKEPKESKEIKCGYTLKYPEHIENFKNLLPEDENTALVIKTFASRSIKNHMCNFARDTGYNVGFVNSNKWTQKETTFRCTICNKTHYINPPQDPSCFQIKCYGRYDDEAHSFYEFTYGSEYMGNMKVERPAQNAILLTKHKHNFTNAVDYPKRNDKYINWFNRQEPIEWYSGPFDEIVNTIF